GTARPAALALWVSPERVDDGRLPKPPKTVRILVDRLPDLDAAVVAYRQVRQFPHWARGATGPVVSTKGLPRVAAFDARLRTSETDGFSWFPLPDRLPAGWYVASLPSATQTIQSIIQVTDVAGYVAISTTKTVVWVNDLASDGPIRGASVEIGGVDAGHTG